MATYRDLQDKINLDYLNNMTLIPETKRAIQTAITCYEKERFWFNEARTVVATSAGQSFISVPTDFLKIDQFEVQINGVYTPLQRETFNYIRQTNQGASQGQPHSYAYNRDRFELSSIPDGIYNAVIYYVSSLTALSADSDTNAWTNEAANLIAHAATVDLLMNVLQVPDQRKVARHELAKERAYSDLASRNDQKFFHRLTPTYF